jgi:hypothetical protein
VRDITGLDRNVASKAERAGSVLTRLGESFQSAESHQQTGEPVERVAQFIESSFLLDWLAGGDACQRNIRGFSLKIETLTVVGALGK